MKDYENKKLGKRGEGIFKTYIDVLGISREQAEYMLNNDFHMKSYLMQESAVGKVSDISVVLSISLNRAKDDFSSLSSEDIEYAKEKYNINLVPVYKEVRKLSILQVYEALELNTSGDNTLSKILKEKFDVTKV